MSLLPVQDALTRILEGAAPLPGETVAISDALDRTLARDLAATRTQPPWDTSAMDGYAVRASDVAGAPSRLRVVGTVPAGHGHANAVGPGEAVRIFTGAPLPAGTDTIVIQEDTEADGETVLVREPAAKGRYVRRRGLDFREGEVLLRAGTRLGPRDLALAAAMNHGRIDVRRRPSVAILATGDELVPPGAEPGPHQIVASNSVGIAAMVRRVGGWPVDLGLAPDDRGVIGAQIGRAVEAGVDVLVTLGGASVGEHDLVRQSLEDQGLKLGFWRIAMRPGKPLMFGRLEQTRVLGLPGNPVSSLVCARLFLAPLIAALLGDSRDVIAEEKVLLGVGLPENDRRQDYLRATLDHGEGGALVAIPFEAQDSSMLERLTRADCLVVRPPHAPPAAAGDTCRILRLDI